MAETISVVFTPINGVPGQFHGTLVYTNSSGLQFYAGATRSTWSTPPSISSALQAEASTLTGIGSDPLGTLIGLSGQVTPSLNTSGPTQNWFDSGNPSAVLFSGNNLSSQWTTITNTIGQINNLALNYAPLDQNSNSAWCTAAINAGASFQDLAAAQVASGTNAPGCQTFIPTTSYPTNSADPFSNILNIGTDAQGNKDYIDKQSYDGTVQQTTVIGVSGSTPVYEYSLPATSSASDNNPALVNGSGASLPISNYVLDAAANAVFQLTGVGNNVTGASGDQVSFTGDGHNVVTISNGTVNADSGSASVDIYGTADTAYGVANSNIGFNTSGSDACYMSDATAWVNTSGVSLNLYGSGEVADAVANTAVGFNDSGSDTYKGSGGGVFLNADGVILTISGTPISTIISGDNETLYASGQDITISTADLDVTVVGNNNFFFGNSDHISVVGNNNFVDGNDNHVAASGGSGNSTSGGDDTDSGTGFSGGSEDEAKTVSRSVIQYDLSIGGGAGAQAVKAETGAHADPFTGAKWSGNVVTWSFAAGSAGASDSGVSISAGDQAVVEQAISAWATASGLSLEEVSDSANTDIRIGWGAPGATPETSYQAEGGQLQSGVSVQLDDLPSNSMGETLYQEALQGIGYALGLANSSDPNSVMSSTLDSANQNLDATDITNIYSLYGGNSVAQLVQAMTAFGVPTAAGISDLPADQQPPQLSTSLLAHSTN